MRKFAVSDRFTTADIGLDLEADRLEELFVAAAEGMFAIILGQNPAPVDPFRHKKINLQAPTSEQLLIDWLSELLYLFDTDSLIACEYDLKTQSPEAGTGLAGTVTFREYHRETDHAEHELKAVTYYKLKIEKDGGLFRCHVVFDL